MDGQVHVVRKGDLDPETEALSGRILGAAIEVHRELGPGLLEGIYEDALAHELRSADVAVRTQVAVPVHYKGAPLRDQRVDLLVGDRIVVEVKSVAAILDVHKAQLLSYLRITSLPLGLLLNFNVALLKSGIARVINERSLLPTLPPSSSRPSDSSSRASR